MIAAQKSVYEFEDLTSEMAQHKAEIHTSSKVLTKEDKEEIQLQKEVSDIDF